MIEALWKIEADTLLCAAASAFVTTLVLAIGLHWSGGWGEKHAPPAWIGSDFVPSSVQICDDFGQGAEFVYKADLAWFSFGWPLFPKPEPVECDHAHTPAPPGVVRWHSCDTLRIDEEVSPPCPATVDGPREGAAWVQTKDGRVTAADVYLQPGEQPPCVAKHEGGHVRGFLQDGHTTEPGHIMATPCDDEWRWLNRYPGQDFPYAISP